MAQTERKKAYDRERMQKKREYEKARLGRLMSALERIANAHPKTEDMFAIPQIARECLDQEMMRE